MKLWRTEGRKGLFITRYNPNTKDVEQQPTQKGLRFAAKVSAAQFRNHPGLFHKSATLLMRAEGTRVRYAHDHIPIPSESKAAMQNMARRAALAGRVLSKEEIKEGAADKGDWRGATRRDRQAYRASRKLRATAQYQRDLQKWRDSLYGA